MLWRFSTTASSSLRRVPRKRFSLASAAEKLPLYRRYWVDVIARELRRRTSSVRTVRSLAFGLGLALWPP